MVQAVKQTVRIQAGGRVELVSPDLPEGTQAEVIVLIEGNCDTSGNCIGLFADEPELMDNIVSDALSARDVPLRGGSSVTPCG